MASVKELKEIIVSLKLDLIEEQIPKGHCPYSYYKPKNGKELDCSIGCDRCRRNFMQDMERKIKRQVEEL